MATWHQMRRPVRLYHDTLWTVLDDAPDECRTSMLFLLESDAMAYIERRKAMGTGRYCRVLRPAERTAILGRYTQSKDGV